MDKPRFQFVSGPQSIGFMADQKFFKQHNEFYLDLHGVLRRDASRALAKRISECRRFGIDQLTVVYGTAEPPYEGSIAAELHRIVHTTGEVSLLRLPPGFIDNPEHFTRRVPKIVLYINRNDQPHPQDDKMGFVPFKASREKERLKRRLCENQFYPLREWMSLLDAVRWIGDGCNVDSLLPLAKTLGKDFQLHEETGECKLRSHALPQLASSWWLHSVQPVVAQRCAYEAAVPEELLMPKSQPTTAPTSLDQSWKLAWDIAHAAMMDGRYEDARARFEQCLEMAEALQLDQHQIVSSLQHIALCHELEYQFEDAEVYYKLALATDTETRAASQQHHFEIHVALAQVLDALGRTAEASDLWKLLREKLQVCTPSNVHWILFTLTLEASLRERLDSPQQSAELLSEALMIADENPGVPDGFRSELRLRLGSNCFHLGNFSEALRLFESVIPALESQFGRTSHLLLLTMEKIAGLHHRRGNTEYAQRVLLNVLERRTAIVGAPGTDRARTLSELGIIYRSQGDFANAEKCYLEAAEILLHEENCDLHLLGNIHNNLGVVFRNTSRHSLAEQQYSSAIEIWRQLFGKDHPKMAEALNNLAMVYADLHNMEAAEQCFKQALDIREILLPPSHPELGFSYNAFGCYLMNIGRSESAEHHLRKALSIRHHNHGDQHPDTIRSMINLCSLYLARGNYHRARPLAKAAITALESGKMIDTSILPRVYSQLASALLGMGDERGARKASERSKQTASISILAKTDKVPPTTTTDSTASFFPQIHANQLTIRAEPSSLRGFPQCRVDTEQFGQPAIEFFELELNSEEHSELNNVIQYLHSQSISLSTARTIVEIAKARKVPKYDQFPSELIEAVALLSQESKMLPDSPFGMSVAGRRALWAMIAMELSIKKTNGVRPAEPSYNQVACRLMASACIAEPDQYKFFHLLGSALIQHGFSAGALAFRKALQLQDNSSSWFGLGMAYMAVGKPEIAQRVAAQMRTPYPVAAEDLSMRVKYADGNGVVVANKPAYINQVFPDGTIKHFRRIDGGIVISRWGKNAEILKLFESPQFPEYLKPPEHQKFLSWMRGSDAERLFEI